MWKRRSVSGRIEDYALIGDTRTAALVGSNGSIDWFCAPRFDAPACFAALLGDDGNGSWRIAPADESARSSRAYRDRTLVLETTFVTDTGSVRLIDCMLMGAPSPRIRRIVEGIDGTVAMKMAYAVRFDYGSIVPWVRRMDGGLLAVAGPGRAISQLRCGTGARRRAARRRVRRRRGRARRLRTCVLRVVRGASAGGTHARRRARSNRRGMAFVVRGMHVRWAVQGRGAPLAPNVARADVRTDRRYRCGADDVASRATGRRAKLGLSVLLACATQRSRSTRCSPEATPTPHRRGATG